MHLFSCGEFNISLVESPYISHEGNDDPSCKIAITASDLHSSFTFGGLGLKKSHLQRIIAEIDNTLAGKHTEDYHLRFSASEENIDLCSPLSFLIHCGETHDKDYWEFIYEENGGWNNSGNTKHSVCMCTDDLINLRQELETQIENFNWIKCGKCDYYEIILPKKKLQTAYYASELKARLSKSLEGKTLKKIYVNLEGYIDRRKPCDNSIDFSLSGGPILLVFDDMAVELCIHGEGMIQYRIFDSFDTIRIVKKRGYAPADAWTNSALFHDLSAEFSLQYENTVLKNVEVESTDMWAFSQSWFDREKAERSGNLPNEIKLLMSNGVQIIFAADDLEWYFIYLRQC